MTDAPEGHRTWTQDREWDGLDSVAVFACECGWYLRAAPKDIAGPYSIDRQRAEHWRAVRAELHPVEADALRAAGAIL